uniref:Egg-lysin n=2 Tax=Haliotis diversicolor TaxID=36095 RepID=Q27286_HALDV|nr:lysin [Haliotis diversicolor]AAB59215.1 sperm lysin [Haliotis diversicolor aquatilis]
MKLLVLCVLAMTVTMATALRGWGYIPRTRLNRAFEVALKVQIIAGFDRKLTSWLGRHGSRLSAIQRKTLYFVNRRYLQTHWSAYMVWINKRIAALGRTATTADYNNLGAEIGRRIPMEVTYSFLVRRNLIPKWRPYMAAIMAKSAADLEVARG